MKKAIVMLLLLALCLCCLMACGSDGICDYCKEADADPFYNENIATKERFEGIEICTGCFREGVWAEE